MNYIPKAGDIVKMRSWHGIVLDVYRNETGKTVLQVQTVRNIFRKLGPELIEVDLAPEHIAPASMEDVRQEITLHQDIQEQALQKFLSYAEATPDLAMIEPAIEV